MAKVRQPALEKLRQSTPYKLFVWLLRILFSAFLCTFIVASLGALDVIPKPVAHRLVQVGIVVSFIGIIVGLASARQINGALNSYVRYKDANSAMVRRHFISQAQLFRDVFFIRKRK